MDPNQIHAPGVFVRRVIALTPQRMRDKRIEKVTVRDRTAGPSEVST